MKQKIILTLSLLLLLFTALAGCKEQEKSSIEELSIIVTEDNIQQLEEYTELKKLDLSGSTCYQAIGEYVKNHPQVEVTYTVQMGSVQASNTLTSLVLDPGLCDYATLYENLAYLPMLKSVSLPQTTFSTQELADLKERYPDVEWNYTVSLSEAEINNEITEIDLSDLEPNRVEEAATILSLFPNISKVELMDADGKSKLSKDDVKKLQESAPHASFHYTFELFGKTVSTTDERIEYVQQEIGNEGEIELRSALDILKGCSYFLLDDCGFDNEVLDRVRSDYYPETKVVWRVHQTNKGRSWLTDTKVLRAVYGINDKNSHVLSYCNEVKYLDLGHNTEMVDISFCASMLDLEIAILSGSPIVDLSPLSNCKKLEFLEIAWCGHITDVSPLAACDGLKHLNIGHTRTKNAITLKGLNLETLSFVNSGKLGGYTEAKWAEIKAAFPDCWITYDPMFDTYASPYGVGWRYKKGGGYTECYAKVREVFELDEIDKLVANGAK